MSNTVPRHVSRRRAAALILVSRDAVDGLIHDGVLRDEGVGRWSKIPIGDVERLLAREITAEYYLAALMASSEARDAQPRRRRKEGSAREVGHAAA